MDQFRQIRYLVAPFFFFASILLGSNSLPQVSTDFLKVMLASFFPIGFLISAAGRIVSGSVFFVITFWKDSKRNETPKDCKFQSIWAYFWGRFHEAILSDTTFRKMLEHLDLPPDVEKRQKYFASNAFDHDVVSKGVNAWLMRAWSGYVMSVDSIVALIGAFFVGVFLPNLFLPNVNPSWRWGIATGLAVLVLLWNAAISWHRYIGMLEFQAQRQKGSFNKREQDLDKRK